MSTRLILGPPVPKKPRKNYRLSNLNNNNYEFVTPNSYGSSPVPELPYDVVDYIFTLLPIKNAAQLGVVAKRFTETWLYCVNLHFEKEFALTHTKTEFNAIVNHVFDCHKGKEIKSFKIFFDPINNDDHLASWTNTCIEKGAVELDLDMSLNRLYEPYFLLPHSFLDVKNLKILKLTESVFQHIPNPTGLSFLTAVVLRKVGLPEQLFEKLFCHCTLLETLDMAQCYGFENLRVHARVLTRFKDLKVANCQGVYRIEIDAPSLRSLYYTGPFRDFVTSEPMFLLHDVVLNFVPSRWIVNPWQASKLGSDICCVRVLTITSTFLEGLSPKIIDGEYREIELSFWYLSELQLIMETPSYCNIGDIACFLKHCPSLDRLFIDVNDFIFGMGDYWEMHQKPLLDNHVSFFHSLKFIKIKGFKLEEKRHLDLLKFLLGKAMFLESMVVVFHKSVRFLTTLGVNVPYWTNLFLSWKLSPRAEICLYHSWDDKSPVHQKHSRT